MSTPIEQADFFTDPKVINDPYPYFDALRSRCPVHPIPQPGVLAVTGYDEAIEIYRDAEAFSSCNAMAGPFPPFPVEPGCDDITEQVQQNRTHWVFNEFMLTKDGAAHEAERSLLRRLMTPRRLKENEDAMAGMADACIDTFVARGHCEVSQDYAKPFTTMVIADLLGIPDEDRPGFAAIFAGQQVAEVGGDSPLPVNPLDFMFDAFTGYVEQRRQEPRQDVLTSLATATYPDGSLPPVDEVVRLALFLFGAGQDTSAKATVAALWFLAENPTLQQRLRAEPHRIPDFFEEVLRLESPTMSDFRMAQKTTTVGGVDVKAGTTMMVHPGAANRDPRKFPNPHELSIERDNLREHLAFGRGVHACPGGGLARAEGRATVERILNRLTDIRISEEQHGPAGERRFQFDPIYINRGLSGLHIEFDVATP